ncbi:schwannomin-interacting protein 1 [Scleropages formosus]|uniref:schwannomin-interacting protein 1 n=1 Tax=Scleropages formosus TaxID=113540 RepID=UPI000878EC76|nr:schwannomin-interacting protein 1-like [Scleropages formosus]
MMEQGVEGEKERQRERGEEKESDEAEDLGKAIEGAALVWQERGTDDDLGLPIMHWEALSLRIAELEKQEEERRERSKCTSVLEQDGVSGVWRDSSRRDVWDDSEDECNSRVIALTSRLQNQMNLQLCFINNSESEDEDDEDTAQPPPQARNPSPTPVTTGGSRSTGFKLEVRAALTALRDKLRTEQKEQCVPCSDTVTKRKKLERSDLQALSLKQLDALRVSLTQSVHDLSSELVRRLLTRDQLRTEQDAMLLEVQDMTL